MCQIAASRRVAREDLSRIPFRASSGRVRRYPDLVKCQLADPATRSGGVTVPAPLLLGRSARTAGFLDPGTRRELEEMLDRNSARAAAPHGKESCTSAEDGLVTVPAPLRTRRPLRSVGFLCRELSRELEDVSVVATKRRSLAFDRMLRQSESRP